MLFVPLCSNILREQAEVPSCQRKHDYQPPDDGLLQGDPHRTAVGGAGQ